MNPVGVEEKYSHMTVEEYVNAKNLEDMERLEELLERDTESFEVRVAEIRSKIVAECEDDGSV